MSQVEYRFDGIIAVFSGNATNTAQTFAQLAAASDITFADQDGNALTWNQLVGGIIPPQVYQGRLQPMQGFRLSVTGAGVVYIAHSQAPTSSSFWQQITQGNPIETREGIGMFTKIQLLAGAATVPIYGEILL